MLQTARVGRQQLYRQLMTQLRVYFAGAGAGVGGARPAAAAVKFDGDMGKRAAEIPAPGGGLRVDPVCDRLRPCSIVQHRNCTLSSVHAANEFVPCTVESQRIYPPWRGDRWGAEFPQHQIPHRPLAIREQKHGARPRAVCRSTKAICIFFTAQIQKRCQLEQIKIH